MNKGIDISEHNGNIDFTNVKNSGIEFVILRIGWIGNKNNHTLDKKFEEYYKQAKLAGLKVGIYVYNYCKSIEAVKSGAKWVLDNLKNREIDMPIFLDMEDNSILDVNNLNLLCKEFCDIINKTQYISGIYANKDWFINKLNIKELLNYKIWLAEWNNQENHTLGYKVDLWQYTSIGEVPGINGRVDLNKCLCNCYDNNDSIINNGDDEEVIVYQNGSTEEAVFSDTNCTNKIGSLNKYEKCECLGIFENRAIVRYKVDNKNNYKIGFVKWLGGVK